MALPFLKVEKVEAILTEKTNLNYFQHRQYVLLLLYLAKQNNFNIEYKKEVKEYLIYLKKFMEINELIENLDYKILCDDLHILYKTIGTNKSDMYINARGKSQATQTAYQITDIIGVIEEEEDEETGPSIPHKLTKQLSSNASPTIRQLMKETSQEDNDSCNVLLDEYYDKKEEKKEEDDDEDETSWFKMTTCDYQQDIP